MENRNKFLENVLSFYKVNYCDFDLSSKIKIKGHFKKYPQIKIALKNFNIKDFDRAIINEFEKQIEFYSLNEVNYYFPEFSVWSDVLVMEGGRIFNVEYNKDSLDKHFEFFEDFVNIFGYIKGRLYEIRNIEKKTGLHFNFNSGNNQVDIFFFNCLSDAAFMLRVNKIGYRNEIINEAIKERIDEFFVKSEFIPYKKRFVFELIKELKANLENDLKLEVNIDTMDGYKLKNEMSKKIINLLNITYNDLLQTKEIEPIDTGIELDLSDTKATEKIIYLYELGILDFLRTKSPFNVSTNALATILSAITKENNTTLQPYLNTIFSKGIDNKNNPYNSTKTVEKVKKQLIAIGFQPK